MFKQLYFCAAIVMMAACGSKKEPVDILVTHATIVDADANRLHTDRLIVINKDTIRLVTDMTNRDRYTAAQTIDATGGYVMPGLWDNHVHFRGGDTLIAENKNLLPLFLSQGVTTVRDCGGDMTPAVMQWKKAIAAGELAGPRIFTSGPKLDGDKPAWPGSIKVVDSTDVQNALDSLQKIGADFVKMYDGSLTREAYYGIIAEAKKRGMKTTGHMPYSADLITASKLGLNGSEHMFYVLKSCSPLADSLTALGLGLSDMIPQLSKTYDPQLAKKVFAELAAKDFYLTPTLYIGKVLANLADEDHRQDAMLPYIGKGIQQTYQRRINSAKRAKAHGNNMYSDLEKVFQVMVRPAYDAGINLLAGSDYGPYNSFVYPGDALHGELEQLVEAGLTPAEALKASYENGPKFFDIAQYYGSIEAGKVADLIIVNKNPLEAISNARTVETVVMGHKIYDKKTLGKMLAEVRE